MAADLSIHTTKNVTDRDLRIFFANQLGSKYSTNFVKSHWTKEEKNNASKHISASPNIWIGEVSWLKAGLLEDAKTFIPDTVQQVSDIIGEDLPIIDDALIQKIADTFALPNKTSYSLAQKDDVVKFLEAHKNERAFTVSW